jgi:hypothetical protein
MGFHTNTVLILEVLPQNLGSFIGSNGSNFKKMISEIKKKIIGKEENITSEEWNKVIIMLKFEKNLINIKANIKCNPEHIEIIKNILDKYVKNHNQENKRFNKKISKSTKDNIFAYKIGASHKYIETLKGEFNCNIYSLKTDIPKIPLVNIVKNISIEKCNKLYQDKYIYLGDKNSQEHIMIFITLDGYPETKYMNSFINNFITNHIKEDVNDMSDSDMSDSDMSDSDMSDSDMSDNGDINDDGDMNDDSEKEHENNKFFNKLLNDPEIEEIYDSFYRWENMICVNKQYGFFKNLEVSRIKRSVSC